MWMAYRSWNGSMTASFNLHTAFTCTMIQLFTVPLIYLFASGCQSPGATTKEASTLLKAEYLPTATESQVRWVSHI